MSVLVTGMLMTNEAIRVFRMVPMSHMKSFIHAYGAIYMEQVAVAAKTEESDTQAHACTRALCLVISALG